MRSIRDLKRDDGQMLLAFSTLLTWWRYLPASQLMRGILIRD